MNPDNGTSETVTTTQPHFVVDIAPPQLIKYLENLDKRLQEFRNVLCFQHILGTSTTFKLIYDKNWSFCSRKIRRSAPIKLWQATVPNTIAMSLHNENEPAFLTYVSNSNEVTVFCPERQELIGRIVRRKNSDGADIFCFATSKSFTTIILQSDMPASMRITDSEGRVVDAAGVTNWKTISKYLTTTYLKQFELQMESGLSEPTRVMLLVTFGNWAMWVNDSIQNGNRMKKISGFGIAALIFLVLVLSHRFYYYRN